MDVSKEQKRAVNNAYALLRQRPRSEFEIRERLRLKGYTRDVIEDTIAQLSGAGEIDDERFARLWVESRMHRNPAGDVVLKHELKARGVSASVIDTVLSEKAAKYDEYAIALEMAKEQFERFKKLDRRKASKRVYDFLMRRGFGYDTMRRILDEFMSGSNDQ
jgi:regulatory protein